MKHGPFAILIFVLMGIVIVFYLPRAGSGADYITTHNQRIDAAIAQGCTIHLHVKTLDLEPEDRPEDIVITEPKQTEWLLTRLRLPDRDDELIKAHACTGHLEINIKSPAGLYTMSYDHGSGAYTLAKGRESQTFVDMDPTVCAELNAYFRSLGLADTHLGIGH